MAAFYSATAALGVADKVTAFTTSEFGRALQHNGRGSDHGWGGHHFVMGGAVLGRRVYGQFPTVALGGPEDSGQGRLIPTTSVDEYASTLVRWFGVPTANLLVKLGDGIADLVDPLGLLLRRRTDLADQVIHALDLHHDVAHRPACLSHLRASRLDFLDAVVDQSLDLLGGGR